MKEIQFKNVKYTIPTSWEDVTVREQLAVSKANDEFKTSQTKSLALIAGYTGIPVDVIRHCTVSEATKLFKYITFIDKPIPTYDVTKPIIFKGVEYHVIKNIMEQEFQDYVTLETAIQNHGNDVYNALPYVLAVMLRKKHNDKYESIDDFNLNERSEEFLNLPIGIANSIAVFFYNAEKTSQILLNLSSLQEDMAIHKKLEEIESTLKEQDGKGLLHKLLTLIIRRYVRLIKKALKKSSNTTVSKYSIKSFRTTLWTFITKKLKINKK